MPILGFFFIIIVLSVLAWLVSEMLPMDPRLKRGLLMIIGIFIFFICVVFMLQLLGINTGIHYRLN